MLTVVTAASVPVFVFVQLLLNRAFFIADPNADDSAPLSARSFDAAFRSHDD